MNSSNWVPIVLAALFVITFVAGETTAQVLEEAPKREIVIPDEHQGWIPHPVDRSHLRPAEAYRIIRNELQKYSQDLADKPELVVANKIDLSDTLEAVDRLRNALDCEVMAISGVTGAGLEPLGKRLWAMIADARAAEQDTRSAEPEDDPFSGVAQEPLAFRPEPPETTHDDHER